VNINKNKMQQLRKKAKVAKRKKNMLKQWRSWTIK